MAGIDLKLKALIPTAPGRNNGSYDLAAMRARPIKWDRVSRVAHDVNCGQNLTCSLAAYTWKGVVLREEQSGNYAAPNDPEVPDCNPRGCQKGVAFTHRMYDPQRIKYPMRRVGERGSGEWERISWDQAFTEIADTLIDVMAEYGPKAVVNAGGTHGETGGPIDWGSLSTRLGTMMPLINSELGDDHQGALEMLGNSAAGSSADDWYHADMIVIWCGNPAYNQMTWYHYFTEARYNGTKVVAITPEYSPSCIAVDEWIPVKPGTDAALGMAMAQVIISEALYKEDFVKEQTDLPLLVRCDTNKFLRESDLTDGGRDYVNYVIDSAIGEITPAPYKRLSLGSLDPLLDGEVEVELGPEAKRVKVRTVFSMLRETADAGYTPEVAAEICGVHAETIRRFAREFAAAEGVVNVITYNPGRFYHGNLMERAMLYNWALCGHLGRKGANFNAQGALFVRESNRKGDAPMRAILEMAKFHPRREEFEDRDFTDYRILKEVFNEMKDVLLQPQALFYYFHAGLLEMSEENESWDPTLKRPLSDYIDQALLSETRKVYPSPGNDPKALVVWGGDPLRRVRANQLLLEKLWPKLDLIFTVDWRWSGSARYSDYVLPACGLYERDSGRLMGGFWQPVAHFTFKAAEPLYESKSDLWIFGHLVRRIAERARERGISTVKDRETGGSSKLDGLDQIIHYDIDAPDFEIEATRDLYEHTLNVEQIPWSEVKERGWVRFTGPGFMLPYSADFAGELEEGEPAIPLTRHVNGKEPWNTATGRIQFYIDHDWYLELDEAFALHKASPKSGGDYPIVLSGTHSRWSIHTCWAEDALMLQLQRGEPVVFVSSEDARSRGISDGDVIRVANDVGDFEIKAIVTGRLPRGFAMISHAWTNAQFRDGRHFQSVMPSPFNPVEFAPATFATYPNVVSDQWAGDPGLNDRDTRVEITKA